MFWPLEAPFSDVPHVSVTEDAYVRFVPSDVEVRGQRNIQRFFQESYASRSPSAMKMRLLSRTIGFDQVVDEVLFIFKHTTEMAWKVPKVRPTNKDVNAIVTTLARLRGGEVCHEHVYWDQASTLVQLGLLDPEALPVAEKNVAPRMSTAPSISSGEPE